jgi:hypothetical protein
VFQMLWAGSRGQDDVCQKLCARCLEPDVVGHMMSVRSYEPDVGQKLYASCRPEFVLATG